MRLYVDVKTNIPDLVIDYIMVRLKDGREVSLNWDESDISRNEKGFTARYKGVYFDEEYANGQIQALEGLKVLEIQSYSEIKDTEYPKDAGLILLSMEFEDGDDTLVFEAPLYSDMTFELTRKDIVIDPDIEVDMEPDDNGVVKGLTAYVEIWFDPDRKFGLDTKSDDYAWVNMYAVWNPLDPNAKARVLCVLSDGETEREFNYEPSDAESNLLKTMITEKIWEVYNCSPEEFCRED